jgi:hypothetical protein
MSVHLITLRNLAKYKIAKPLNLQMFGLADILPTGSCFFLCRAALCSEYLFINGLQFKIPNQAIECLLGLCHFYSLMLRCL